VFFAFVNVCQSYQHGKCMADQHTCYPKIFCAVPTQAPFRVSPSWKYCFAANKRNQISQTRQEAMKMMTDHVTNNQCSHVKGVQAVFDFLLEQVTIVDDSILKHPCP
jgi:hypothetical protein